MKQQVRYAVSHESNNVTELLIEARTNLNTLALLLN